MTRSALLAAALLTTPAAAQQATVTYPPYPQAPGTRSETVAVTVTGEPGARRFDLSTSASQRDDAPQRRTVRELADAPWVATGNAQFDALFALAVDDARRNSVREITDGQYNGGKPIPCRCFETGEKWHYVWTRDLSYALDLGLAGLDPARAVASLTFKTGALRLGVPRPPELSQGTLQIVQDTGSGGSWPVSTDRTAWALGAERTLANLYGAERAAFAARALAALRGTLEADRTAAFDARNGLYGGEHSFLDWREQTYPAWIVNDLSAMAEMKALSTNILQYRAQRLAARLAREAGDAAIAARYAGWADALAPAIRSAFWDKDAGLFATFLSADPTPARIAKYDLLGNDLAILSGIADARQSTSILSRYPFAPFGPPVVWPQAPQTFVYHNRAQWPFVTAYTLRAAAETGHVAAADRSLDALIRGSALHLSNMENLEWLTGLSRYDDGPEINSARQLWSVGGYLGAVTGTIFGWRPEPDGVRIAPFLTSHARALMGDTARLTGLRFAGKPVDIALALPPRVRDGRYYPVESVRLNGAPAPARITAGVLRDGANLIEITFGKARRPPRLHATNPRHHRRSRRAPRREGVARPALRRAAGRRCCRKERRCDVDRSPQGSGAHCMLLSGRDAWGDQAPVATLRSRLRPWSSRADRWSHRPARRQRRSRPSAGQRRSRTHPRARHGQDAVGCRRAHRSRGHLRRLVPLRQSCFPAQHRCHQRGQTRHRHARDRDCVLRDRADAARPSHWRHPPDPPVDPRVFPPATRRLHADARRLHQHERAHHQRDVQ
jgi:hypothetical protein